MIEVLRCCDSLVEMQHMFGQSVDLIFGSPPYEDCRDIPNDPFPVKQGQDWVDWMISYFRIAQHVSKGLIAFVVQGKTRKYKWSCTPALLIADLHRLGFNVRNPAIYSRVGIPGSGGPDWLRSDYEWIVCVSHPGRLPWIGRPRWPVGGAISHRKQNGSRITKPRGKDGKLLSQEYKPPQIVNPGNIIHCNAGGGLMGSKMAYANEAPFPEKLAEFFIRSFCPPGGVVLDPFCGSSTTGVVAKKWGRGYIGLDIRKSQIELSRWRLREEFPDV